MGNDYLERFLKNSISLDDNFGKTYVFLSDDNQTIIGYYNLGMGYIEQFDTGITRKIGGAVHINCFALDEKYHGLVQAVTEKGLKINLSDILLDDCMSRIEEIRRNHLDFMFVTLNSTKEGYSLYLRNTYGNFLGYMLFYIQSIIFPAVFFFCGVCRVCNSDKKI